MRGGGHDWAGRALCDGVVIDVSGMNSVVIDPAAHTARISGGARASDVVKAADPFGLTPVTGSVGTVGVAGLTLGGGYGPLIGRFGVLLVDFTIGSGNGRNKSIDIAHNAFSVVRSQTAATVPIAWELRRNRSREAEATGRNAS